MTTKNQSSWTKVLSIGLLASAIVAVIALAISWPSVTSSPKNIPVNVVASEESFQTMTHTLESTGKELPFELTRVDSRAEAEEKITTRQSYGAFILPSPEQPTLEVLTAPAANKAIATMISTAGGQMHKMSVAAAMQKMQNAPAAQPVNPEMLSTLTQSALQDPTITEVVPLTSKDQQGSGMMYAFLPLLIGGLVGGVLISLKISGIWNRVLALVVFPALEALTILLIMHNWFGLLPQATFALWAGLTLAISAISSLVVGLHSLKGAAGIGIAAVLTMFIGNPISGAMLPLEFLPWHWATISSWLVPGAAQQLLRNLSYFPDASNASSWIVLSIWLLGGLALLALSATKKKAASEN
ncbi:ABC transporter permease [Corynebacterium sp. sy017]|uniref:ABC transporter permease n=1 Tax=unclassified Corynebacterium TaxID=2624378 RepID=UPI001186F970|nr:MULTISPECIES: ABC transporter permease [unclassified Corynebacterium]MBP3089400.1 ABC transporter permease [Corynebacterium sp. sy017]TSD90912.1 ABC transporter permease [Corynebacterium sp. SY003]